jgi:anti-sigma regulatory factor (Ser/Thr protein kinase)
VARCRGGIHQEASNFSRACPPCRETVGTLKTSSNCCQGVTLLQLDVSLPRDSRASALARRALASWRHSIEPELLDDLELLVSELIANSVRHAGPSPKTDGIHLRALAEAKRVRVEVVDPGNGFSHVLREPGPMQAGGRGLYLVEVLADRWGIESEPSTCVWFELARRVS